MLYQFYELTHAAMAPMRTAAKLSLQASTSAYNPFRDSYPSRLQNAQLTMFINATKRYDKPEFNIDHVEIEGETISVKEKRLFSKPFCTLIQFQKKMEHNHPPVLIVAPLSGHYATLLRGTVKQMLKDHDVYITDWSDARDVSVTEGEFDLDDYSDYIRDQLKYLHKRHNERVHVLAVCQPGIPVTVATSLMAEDNDPARPASLTLMGSPIDVTVNPQGPNEFATSRPLSWFENNVIMTVPFPNRGFGRRVYPGFVQLQGFMAMNMDRHVDAHMNQFRNLIKGDGDSASAHRAFYDEYLAVMDLSAEFYLQTIDRVFQQCLLAKGEYDYRDRRVDPSKITDIPIFAIEGKRDDITGIGQTKAVLKLASGLPDDQKQYLLQPKVGHYGIFNGSRWREIIYPQVLEFIAKARQN